MTNKLQLRYGQDQATEALGYGLGNIVFTVNKKENVDHLDLQTLLSALGTALPALAPNISIGHEKNIGCRFDCYRCDSWGDWAAGVGKTLGKTPP